MPGRNVVKQYVEDAYYHVYNRGVEKRVIFLDEADYAMFLNLLKRHLSRVKQTDNRGMPYENYHGKVELLAYCLMPNHYHFLFYLDYETASISELMRRVAGAYTTYFNKKYERIGHLFQGVFKASRIGRDDYLEHISRYIHLNPVDYLGWQFSSYRYYKGEVSADWVRPERIMAIFNDDFHVYEEFVADYIGRKAMMDELKHILADH